MSAAFWFLLGVMAGIVLVAVLLAIAEELPHYAEREQESWERRQAAERLIAETPARKVDA